MFRTKLGAMFCAGVVGSSLCAAEVTIDTWGHAGVLYNQGFIGNNKNHSVIGLSAHAGANFILDNGLYFGLGAVGAWAALDNKKDSFAGLTASSFTSSRYPNTGDVSNAFIGYKGNNWQLNVGRFDGSFLEFDWLANNIQGVGFNMKNIFKNRVVNKMDVWATYFNSALITGYQPSRIASELATMYAFHPGGRSIVGANGGNIVAGGLNMNLGGFILDPYLLINSSAAGSNEFMFQLGTRFGYEINFARDWKSSTMLRLMFQLAPNYLAPNEDLGGLVWVEQKFSYQNWIDFGAGFHFIGGQNIWTLNDHMPFYGGLLNTYNRDYMNKNAFSFYIFGDMRFLNDKLNLDILLAGGEYSEISAIIKYRAWQGRQISVDVGGGYVYSSTGGFTANNRDNLVVFAKMGY